MTAIGDVKLVLGDEQGAALTLNARREGEAARPQSLGDIDGKAGQDRAVAHGQAEDQMLCPGAVVDHGVEIDRVLNAVDRRRSRDTHRADVAARQRRARHRRAQGFLPRDLAVAGVERIDGIVLGRDDHQLPAGLTEMPEQRLCIDVPLDPSVEIRIDVHFRRALIGEVRHDVEAAAHRIVVKSQNGLCIPDLRQQKQHAKPGNKPKRAAEVSHVSSSWSRVERYGLGDELWRI